MSDTYLTLMKCVYGQLLDCAYCIVVWSFAWILDFVFLLVVFYCFC